MSGACSVGSRPISCNVFSIDAEADLGEFGVGQMKFQGGVKRGIKSLRFASPKPLEEAKGRFAEVYGVGKTGDTHKAFDLEAEEVEAVVYGGTGR